jgi:hypothetical protein
VHLNSACNMPKRHYKNTSGSVSKTGFKKSPSKVLETLTPKGWYNIQAPRGLAGQGELCAARQYPAIPGPLKQGDWVKLDSKLGARPPSELLTN